jgi:large repetitive protein
LRNSNTTGVADIDFGFGAPGQGWLPIVGNWVGPAGSPLMATDAVNASGADLAPLASADLQPIVAEALARWADAGLAAGTRSALAHTTFVIADLPGATLGRAYDHTIYIDRDAAGHGWFIDPTPAANEEFTRSATDAQLDAVDARAVDRMDLLTVVEHELGYVVGLDDLDGLSSGLMSATLKTGVRRLAGATEVDAVLARDDAWLWPSGKSLS